MPHAHIGGSLMGGYHTALLCSEAFLLQFESATQERFDEIASA